MSLSRRIALMLGVALYVALPGLPAAELPVPCAGGSCTGVPGFVTDGAATAVVNPAGTTLDVNQTSNRAVLNWAEFNVGAGRTVNFKQPGADALAVNRIFQGSPSQIFGAINANGQIYLINQNGILFKPGSQVNVSSLIASSLEIDPEALSGGILNPSLLTQGKAAFASDGRVFVLDADGQVVNGPDGQPLQVRVAVEEGATLKSDASGGGRIALLGQQVGNAGTIEAPGGQAILAAGEKVYLQASEDPALRGLLVEVDVGGTAWNQATGQISSSLGNVTLVGLAVNQEGRASATTSVQANGSVRLLARDTVTVTRPTTSTFALLTQKAGAAELGSGSVTEVTPDQTTLATTAVDDQRQLPSTVEVVGREVTFRQDSLVRAPGGQITVQALPDPSVTRPTGETPLPVDSGARILVESGARIDASGSTADVSITRNVVAVELRSNELKDAPLQRDGALRGKTVFVDARVGTPLADVSGALATIPRDVNERTSAGGTISLLSQGSVDVAAGATIDVSGGGINYAGGVIRTSWLVTPDRRLVEIGSADPGSPYIDVLNPTIQKVYQRWGIVEERPVAGFGRFEPGYFEGRDAGTVQIAAPGIALNGSLLGQVTPDVRQRTPATQPLGGRLVIGLPDGQGLTLPDFRAPSIRIADGPGSGTGTGDVLDLATRYFDEGGFTRTALYSNGTITVAPGAGPLTTGPRGSLQLTAARVDINRSVSVPGGTIEARSVNVNPLAPGATGERPGVALAAGVALDTSGRWVNDTPGVAPVAPADPVVLDGGRVTLAVDAVGGELRTGDGVALLADGGAWLDAQGRLQTGGGGEIAVLATGTDASLATLGTLDLSAWGLQQQGGTLSFGANRIRVAADGAATGEAQTADPLAGDVPYVLRPEFFEQGGFREYRVVASGRRTPAGTEPLVIAGNAALGPRQQQRQLAGDFRRAATGTAVAAVSREFLPRPDLRSPADLAFAYAPHDQVTPASAGTLVMEQGASIVLDPGGTVDFSAPTRIRVDGSITAPAGAVTATLSRPSDALDDGFDTAVGIFFGGQSLVDLSGVFIPTPNDLGLRLGTVRDGGSVTLVAERGRIELAAGATIDVAGAQAVLDLPAGGGVSTGPVTVATAVGSRGGRVDLLAPEGLVLDATLRGAGGTAGNAGATLSLGVSRERGFDVEAELLPTFPNTPREIVVGSGVAPANGVAALDPLRLAGSGFDSLVLQADGRIRFAAPLELAVRNRLELQAPTIVAPVTGDVALQANYVALGPQLRSSLQAGAATAGPARLDVTAGAIDLFGDVALQGFGDVALSAQQDIRATGLSNDSGTVLAGSLSTAGNLTMTAAQVYPTTFSDYLLRILPGSGPGTLRVLPSGQAPGTVLSAAARLRVEAANIEQAGVLRAPLGEIELNATGALDLAPGSVTSTASVGQVVPFGRVSAGTSWTYEAIPGLFASIATPRAQRIALNADQVRVADGASVDVRGGGDVYAYEFLPGPGGSTDALATGANPNLFAIVPGVRFGTYDTQEYRGTSLQPGDSVRIAEVPGLLPAGEYALLPARYALLPGAVLVEARPEVQDIVPGEVRSLADGAPVAAGVRTIAGAGLADSRTIGFAVRPGSFGRELAEYRDYFGNSFFPARAQANDVLPPLVARDAGAVQFGVGSELELSGQLLLDPDRGDPATPGDDGRGARIDLSAERLRVVATAGSAPAGVVEVEAAALGGLPAESILLGGVRRAVADGVEIDPAARTVEIAENVTLTGNEVVLVGRETVTVGDGARLATTGERVDQDPGVLRITGNAGSAVVRVSRRPLGDIERTSTVAAGDVLIGNGATLAASGSVLVDAAGTARSFGGYEVGTGGLAFGSRRIVLGADQAAVTDGLALDASKLAAVGAAGELRLRARDGIDVAGTATLGTATERPERLVIDAPAIRRVDGDAAFQAGELVVRNTSGLSAPDPVGGSGSLSLVADQLVFAGGDFAVAGFDAFSVEATSAVVGRGDSMVRSGAAMDFRTPLLTGDPGSQLTLAAPGRAVTLARPAAGAGQPAVAAVGAALEVSGGSVSADTALLYPAGRVRLVADEGVTLGSNAVVDVSGRRLEFAGERVDVPGGAVEVVARTGGVQFVPGSRVDVSASTGEAAAGSLRILAADGAALDGVLEGRASDADASGLFDLVAAGIGSLGDLAARLASGGFQRFIGIETTGGDLALAAGETLRANEVVVAASGGALTVDGQVDASRADGGGSIVLAARDDLALGATAVLDARATGTSGSGGDIFLASTAGDARLGSGARLRLDGAGGEPGGELLVRVAADGSDARLATFDASIEGAAERILEPVTVVGPVSNVIASDITAFRNALNTYMAAAPGTIRGRLGSVADGLLIRPGLEVVGDGDVSLGSPWDFAAWRWDGQPGYLTVRATGGLEVGARISDGFTGSNLSLNQLATDSWSYRLVAGADRDSALPLAVRGRLLDAGDETLALGGGIAVRTGTGDIRLASAGDIAFGDNTTTVYTAGVAGRTPINTGGRRASWSRDGGDISLAAARDILAELPSQLLSGWNVRISPTGPVQWAIDYNRFAQGIGALAGGRVDISAGRDVANVAATVATTRGEIPGQLGTFETWGGGDLQVTAGRDVLGGIWSTWDGDTAISAGRSITLGTTADFTEIAPTIASGRGQVSLLARSGVDVGAFVNPTVVSPTNFGAVALRTFFYNYLPTDAVTLTSLAGDVRVFNDVLALDSVLPGASGDTAFGVLPPTLRARAVGGDVELVNGIRMLPGPTAQLELIAAGSLRSPNGAELIMSDALPAALPSADVPAESGVNAEAPFLPTARAAIHTGDAQPVVMVAASGDIAGGAYEFAKHFRVVAARDVRDISLSGQNTSPTQISLVEAGRDIRLGSSSQTLNDRIELGGPGRLQVIAGRNIELGFSRGITSVGPTLNPQLPAGGAAVDVWAGLGAEPAYAGFNQRYWVGQYGDELARYTAGDAEFPGLIGYVAEVTGRTDLTADNVWTAWAALEQAQQQAYLQQLQPQDRITFASFVDLVDVLVSYTNSVTGQADLQPTTAVDAYLGFGVEQQRPLVQEFFFRELRDSGREANVSRSRFGFQRGQDAVATLFPEADDYTGDLGLLFSRIYTLAGGDISLLVPGGLLNVGLAVPPSDQAITRQPSELGIVTQGPGRVQVFSDGDVLVNQSRIFTLQGGDITIWSDNGNIDAGRGSKTSISAPPPVIRVDAGGNVTVEFADAIAGSGIRGILTDDSIVPGDVDLVAPNGEINAGDAGIGSAGNINIAAPIVVGVDNIQVGGAATGVPTDTGLAAGLTGVSGLSNAVAQSAQSGAAEGGPAEAGGSLADAALALLDVLIEGYGDGSNGDDDSCDPATDPRCRP